MSTTGSAIAPGLVARLAALDLLSATLDQGAMLDDARVEASPAERAEARSLADLTLRRLGQIDALVAHFVPKAPKPPVNHVLRIMAAELAFAGTAPHAAVDLAVRAVKARKAGKMSGLINAVGRKLAAQSGALVARQQPERLNMPGSLFRLLADDWGKPAARAMATAHLVAPPHDLTLRDPTDATGLIATTGATLLPNGSLRLPGRPQISALPGYGEGQWWLQDVAATLPAMMIPEARGKRILDLCAAPGGKTLQLAAAGADVTALDLSAKRLERLAENLARTRLTAQTIAADALQWTPEAPFDAILLDAPCSATGTIRRHPDLPHRFREKSLASLTTLQSQLLERAFTWLKPGGYLVYCTCSLLKREGENQITAFLDREPGARVAPITAPALSRFAQGGILRTRPDQWPDTWPVGTEGTTTPHARNHLDGFFACRLQRAQ